MPIRERVLGHTFKHVFHPECIRAWLETHLTCPLCYEPVAPENVREIQGINNHNPLGNPTPAVSAALHRLDMAHMNAEQMEATPEVRAALEAAKIAYKAAKMEQEKSQGNNHG